jgi:cysteinyl-tRNA synthetase
MHNAWVTAAGEKMSKSLGNGALVSEVTKQYPPRAVRFYLAQPHYRSAIEFSDTSLTEAAAALQRIDNFVSRATDVVGVVPPRVPTEFVQAMNDDLGTPAAFAVIYNAVRDGNVALDAGDQAEVSRRLGEVSGMLDVLGLDPNAPAWQASAEDLQLARVVDDLVAELLKQRQAARERKDFAAADGIRDSLATMGVEIADTPRGPRWSLSAPAPDRGE